MVAYEKETRLLAGQEEHQQQQWHQLTVDSASTRYSSQVVVEAENEDRGEIPTDSANVARNTTKENRRTMRRDCYSCVAPLVVVDAVAVVDSRLRRKNSRWAENYQQMAMHRSTRYRWTTMRQTKWWWWLCWSMKGLGFDSRKARRRSRTGFDRDPTDGDLKSRETFSPSSSSRWRRSLPILACCCWVAPSFILAERKRFTSDGPLLIGKSKLYDGPRPVLSCCWTYGGGWRLFFELIDTGDGVNLGKSVLEWFVSWAGGEYGWWWCWWMLNVVNFGLIPSDE